MNPVAALLRERCQFENTIYRYPFPLGFFRRLRRGVRRLSRAPRAVAGAPSRYVPGAWVRVRDADAIRATLDANGRTRGLTYTDAQWAYCGKTFAVDAIVRRMLDDAGRMRSIARTVSLHGVDCDGIDRDGGCGRACALLFRDEWLEPSTAEHAEPPAASRFARVRSSGEIAATLDRDGRRDGVMFSAAMQRYAGQRFAVHKRVQPIGATPWRRPASDWYILEGLRCHGESLGSEGPCDRGCGLLWHPAWLEFD